MSKGQSVNLTNETFDRQGKPTVYRVFSTMSEAFDYCREKDAPVLVMVRKIRYKLFPSGRGECLGQVGF